MRSDGAVRSARVLDRPVVDRPVVDKGEGWKISPPNGRPSCGFRPGRTADIRTGTAGEYRLRLSAPPGDEAS